MIGFLVIFATGIAALLGVQALDIEAGRAAPLVRPLVYRPRRLFKLRGTPVHTAG